MESRTEFIVQGSAVPPPSRQPTCLHLSSRKDGANRPEKDRARRRGDRRRRAFRVICAYTTPNTSRARSGHANHLTANFTASVHRAMDVQVHLTTHERLDEVVPRTNPLVGSLVQIGFRGAARQI